MPWDRSLYPDNWDAIAEAVKESQGYVCADCGRQCLRPGEPVDDFRDVMSCAHWPDPTPSNVDRDNLVGLCSSCHLRRDAPRIHRVIKYGRASLDPAHQPGLFPDLVPFHPSAGATPLADTPGAP